jgi:putative peptide zinc metalloprotease protein
MGVAFLVLFPVLYTDNTEAYRLNSKYKRLKIVLAGMKVELYLAMIATFLWSILPDGIFKSIAFIIATTSWITSLLINISPFLRFDGYYALADITNTKNLQPRAFGMMRWYIRAKLLGLKEPKPEHLKKSKENFFIIYAIMTAIYRFFLFLGIALLVYHMVFKALGLVLFLVEIVWFILLPIYNELKIWYQKRESLEWNRYSITSVSISTLFVATIFIPIKESTSVPAILQTTQYSYIYTPKESYIKDMYIKNNQYVQKGETLISMESDEIKNRLDKLKLTIEKLTIEYNKISTNKDKIEQRFVLQEEILKSKQEYKGLEKEYQSLEIRAPFSGVVSFVDRYNKNQPITPQVPMMYIYNPNEYQIIGYLSTQNRQNIKEDSKGKFVANSPDIETISVSNISIDKVSTSNIQYPELTSKYSGTIAVRDDNNKNLISESSYYKIVAKPNKDIKINRRVNGVLKVESTPTSILSDTLYFIYNTLIKESSF